MLALLGVRPVWDEASRRVTSLEPIDLEELGRPYVLDQADVEKAGKAYPGTMVVYTVAKLRNLEPSEAEKVALFIRTATTDSSGVNRARSVSARMVANESR